MKNIIGIINFNTLCKKNSSSFISSRDYSWHDHKLKVLCPENIKFRINILTKYSLPNLLKNIPNEINFKLIILYSTLLEQQYKNILIDYALRYNSIILESRQEDDYLDINGSIKRCIKQFDKNHQNEETLFASFRLDDDDILSSEYINNISKHIIHSNVNKFITFSSNLECLWDDNQIINLYQLNRPFMSPGLCHIGLFDNKMENFLTNPQTVYAGISHFDIPKKFEYIIDESPYSFIYSRHKYQDTSIKYKFSNTNVIQNDNGLSQYFPFIRYV